MIEAFFTSTFLIALGEIGDKTQLLALMLAARFRRPWIIIAGIFFATLLNHAFAGLVGGWFRTYFHPDLVQWVLGSAFILMGLWVLIPDKLNESDEFKNTTLTKTGMTIFIITFSTFFVAEIGDKTQLATIALAARFDSLPTVILATTFGMMLANIPAVWLGTIAYKRIPIRFIHGVAALFFIISGAFILIFGLPMQDTVEQAHLLHFDTTPTPYTIHDSAA